jgi:hypothetical protein
MRCSASIPAGSLATALTDETGMRDGAREAIISLAPSQSCRSNFRAVYCAPLVHGTMPRPTGRGDDRPTIVPSSPPAAAPITALFMLRPVIPPMMAPAAAPMPALCARVGPRLTALGADDGWSTVGSRPVVITTSPPAALLSGVRSTGVVDTGSRGLGASSTRPVATLDLRVPRSVDGLAGAGRATVDCAPRVRDATRGVTVGCARVTRCVVAAAPA